MFIFDICRSIVSSKIAFVVPIAVLLLSESAKADVALDHQIVHWNGPDFQTDCAKWAYPWSGSKICVGHAYKFMNHTLHLIVEGPPAAQAIRNALNSALSVAVGACGAAYAATPSPEPTIRAGACYAAAKIAFIGAATADALLKQYSLEFRQRNWW